jgi:hypothetical protein
MMVESDGNWRLNDSVTLAQTSGQKAAPTKMKYVQNKWLIVPFFLWLTSSVATAQTGITAFLPEVESYFRFSPKVRLLIQTKGTWRTATSITRTLDQAFSSTSVPLKNCRKSRFSSLMTSSACRSCSPSVIATFHQPCNQPSIACNPSSCFMFRFPVGP